MVLEPLYEQDFLGCSYGFRPGRSADLTLDALWQKTMAMGGGWILDVDNFESSLTRSTTALSGSFCGVGYETECCFD